MSEKELSDLKLHKDYRRAWINWIEGVLEHDEDICMICQDRLKEILKVLKEA